DGVAPINGPGEVALGGLYPERNRIHAAAGTVHGFERELSAGLPKRPSNCLKGDAFDRAIGREDDFTGRGGCTEHSRVRIIVILRRITPHPVVESFKQAVVAIA